MQKLTQDMLNAIEKNIPSQMSGVLLQRFKELEEYKTKYEKIYDDNIALNSHNKELMLQINILERLKNDVEKIKEDRQYLELDRLKLTIESEMKNLRATEANSKVDMLNNLVGLLMKNPQAVTSMLTSNDNIKTFKADGGIDIEKLGSSTIVMKND